MDFEAKSQQERKPQNHHHYYLFTVHAWFSKTPLSLDTANSLHRTQLISLKQLHYHVLTLSPSFHSHLNKVHCQIEVTTNATHVIARRGTRQLNEVTASNGIMVHSP